MLEPSFLLLSPLSASGERKRGFAQKQNAVIGGGDFH
jgi:hypothetical protein